MSRIPIRIKLTLAFAIVMMAVLASAGLFLYLSLAASLDKTINQGLYARAADVSTLVREADSGLRDSGRSTLSKQSENFAQILTVRGRVVDATPGYKLNDLLTARELQAAARRTTLIDNAKDKTEGAVRLLATPVNAQDLHRVVLVGTALEQRQNTLNTLRGLLFVGGGLALLLASLAGYLVAAAALRPVESMRKRAETISGETAGVRLPLPNAEDEIQRLGATLNAMLARLELAATHEREFISDASHELRTPLSVLRTELELSLRRSRTIEEFEAAMRSALDETERLVQLAEDLLVLARLDQGKMPLHPTATKMRPVFTTLQSRYEQRPSEPDCAFVTIADSELTVYADPIRLDQAITNLVENALRHGAGIVTLEAAKAQAGVVISVEDHGPGFPPEFLPRVFDRFSRASESRQEAGSGLGLAIVSSIAESHGGTATAMNAESGGARVEIYFPAAK